jgi:hypothetical protein
MSTTNGGKLQPTPRVGVKCTLSHCPFQLSGVTAEVASCAISCLLGKQAITNHGVGVIGIYYEMFVKEII